MVRPALLSLSQGNSAQQVSGQVIIRGTKGFVDGQNKEYSDLEILQMIGRAGRPQYDSIGVGAFLNFRFVQRL